MTVRVFDDGDVIALTDAARCRAWMRAAILDAHHGRAAAPPRVHADLGTRRLAVTAGTGPDGSFGHRTYVAPGDGHHDQVTVLYRADGKVEAIHVGNQIGPRRVGAIGALALIALGPTRPSTMAVIGSGEQAWHQVWAVADDERITDVRVHSPNPEHRERFASRVRLELDLPARAFANPRPAVDGEPIVVLATGSATPVVDAAWVDPCAYVATVGPKQVARHEFPIELANDASIVTDSVSQIGAYDPPHVLRDRADQIIPLGAVIEGEVDVDRSRRRVFLSVGLAGTEVAVLRGMLGAA